MFTDNEYFKKLELKSFPEIQNKLLTLHREKLFPIKKQAVTIVWTRENYLDLFDEINEIADEMKTSIMVSKFFITPEHDNLGVHVDSTKVSHKNWALNIPVLSHEDGHSMTWYDYHDEFKKVSDSYNKSLQPKYVEKLVPLSTLMMEEPHYVKIGIFHGIKNPTPTPRIMLTIRFRNSFVDF